MHTGSVVIKMFIFVFIHFFFKDTISLTGPAQSRRYGDTTSLASVNSQVRLIETNNEDTVQYQSEMLREFLISVYSFQFFKFLTELSKILTFLRNVPF